MRDFLGLLEFYAAMAGGVLMVGSAFAFVFWLIKRMGVMRP